MVHAPYYKNFQNLINSKSKIQTTKYYFKFKFKLSFVKSNTKSKKFSSWGNKEKANKSNYKCRSWIPT